MGTLDAAALAAARAQADAAPELPDALDAAARLLEDVIQQAQEQTDPECPDCPKLGRAA